MSKTKTLPWYNRSPQSLNNLLGVFCRNEKSDGRGRDFIKNLTL